MTAPEHDTGPQGRAADRRFLLILRLPQAGQGARYSASERSQADLDREFSPDALSLLAEGVHVTLDPETYGPNTCAVDLLAWYRRTTGLRMSPEGLGPLPPGLPPVEGVPV